ncbi:YmaF family protein [Bacillota bacterium Meth-B3]|nr:YmaF family protein [Christensenellaceae bacterium]
MQGFTHPACADAHVHELVGSVKLADCVCTAHGHRLAGISGPPIAFECGGHAHEVFVRTDSFEGHAHEFVGMTCDAVAVSACGAHVHYLEGMVSRADTHRHCFKLATLINDPIAE